RSQYFCQNEDIKNFKLAETIPGPSIEALIKVARQKRIVIVASVFEKRTAGIYHNTAVVIDANGKIAGKYRKMHIPDDPLYYEKFISRPADSVFALKERSKARLARWCVGISGFPKAGA